MDRFFRTDNAFFTGLTKVFWLIVLNAVFVIFSIPLVTFGASFTALYYAVNKNLKFNRGYTFRSFWDGFKKNFKQSAAANLIFMALTFVLLGDAAVFVTFAQAGTVPAGIEVFFYVMIGIIWLYAIWVFTYIAMFEDGLRTVFKNCAVLFVTELPTTLFCMVITGFAIIVIYLIPVLLILMPGVGVWLMSMRLQRSFRKYMTDEQRELEDELNDMKVYDDKKL